MSIDPTNPYAASTTEASVQAPSDPANPYPPCPKCRAKNAKKVSYTWWGGLLGPAIFKVVKCQSCKTSYSGKNGKYLGGLIAIYMVVGLAIGLAVGVMLAIAGA